jgi:hypothetical protein
MEAAAVLPSTGAIGGWAAARVLGVRVLDGRGIWGGREEPVLLCLGPGQIRTRSGMSISRSPLAEHDVRIVAGIRVTTPLRTAFDCLRLAPRLEDAVAFGDLMLHCRLVDLAELAMYVCSHRGWKGIARARRALMMLDAGSRNPWESRFRVLWMVDAGMPRPRCNAPLRDEFGGLLGIVDLLDEAAGVVGEFDGGGHRDIDIHTYDNIREGRLEDYGLEVVRATSVDFAHRARTAGRCAGERTPARREMTLRNAAGPARTSAKCDSSAVPELLMSLGDCRTVTFCRGSRWHQCPTMTAMRCSNRSSRRP